MACRDRVELHWRNLRQLVGAFVGVGGGCDAVGDFVSCCECCVGAKVFGRGYWAGAEAGLLLYHGEEESWDGQPRSVSLTKLSFFPPFCSSDNLISITCTRQT